MFRAMVSCGQALDLSASTSSLSSPAPSGLALSQDSVDSPPASSHQPQHRRESPERTDLSSLQPPPHHPPGHPRGPPGPGLLRGVNRGSSVRPPPPHGAHSLEFGPLVRPMPIRPPFFIREIYKNGFLKRLPYNERKSSALAKLMKSDRFWVVFSIHDDVHPFLELWHEPTEVASKPPVYVFPLAACQHISPSLIASDSEWSFVINFATAMAIR